MIADKIVVDSVTHLYRNLENSVAYCASHGGSYSGALVLSTSLRAIILSDAGVGLDQAGIASLDMLELEGMPAATIGHRSARIGDGMDGVARGIISYVNAPALSLGVHPGMHCEKALDIFSHSAKKRTPISNVTPSEHRTILSTDTDTKIVIADSASLLNINDQGQIVICGSHGGLLGGDPSTAVSIDVHVIIFNDADYGVDDAGISRLAALDTREIAAACVSAWSAQIGDGLASYNTGVISAINKKGLSLGGFLGMTTKEFVSLITRISIFKEKI